MFGAQRATFLVSDEMSKQQRLIAVTIRCIHVRSVDVTFPQKFSCEIPTDKQNTNCQSN